VDQVVVHLIDSKALSLRSQVAERGRNVVADQLPIDGVAAGCREHQDEVRACVDHLLDFLIGHTMLFIVSGRSGGPPGANLRAA